MKTKLIRILAAVSLAAVSVATLAQPVTLEFNSLNRKQGFPALLEHRAQYTDKISGVLTRPANATGNVPAMIIMHSSGGIIPATWEWSNFFLQMGVATFVVDSFGPRGIADTGSDSSQLNYGASVADSLLALKTLAAQPGIDSKRIGVIGFSRGAVAAATSSFENIRAATLGSNNPLRFALHVPFYGGCTLVGTTTGAPMLFFFAGKEEYVPPESCPATANQLRARGADVTDVMYPNAYHSFDVERSKHVYLAKGESWTSCSRTQDMDTMNYYVSGKQVTPKEYAEAFSKCTKHGVTIGYDYSAKSDSREKTKAFVAKVFGL